MKAKECLRNLLGLILWVTIPMFLSAKESAKEIEAASLNKYIIENQFTANLTDEVPPQEDKGKDKKKPKEADRAEPKKEPKDIEVERPKPDIKEVPKSRPKLRPGVVTDGIKVKRPPIKVGKPGRG
jgi:hypothetical protein